MQQLQKHRVGPAESDYILRISRCDACFRSSRHHFVFFPNVVLVFEILKDGRKKLARDSIGIDAKFLAPQSFYGQELDRSPAVREIPLCLPPASAHVQPSRLLK